MTAYPSMTLALALTLCGPASAQIIPTGTPAADITLSTAIADWRIFVTCSVLDPATHRLVLDALAEDTAAAMAILTANQVPVEAISAFQAAASPYALTPAPDTPFEEVAKLCATQADWSARWREGRLTPPCAKPALGLPEGPTMTTPVALMSCIRNEGIHVVEWLAYHRVIGFGPIIICTNDCTDGTDHLLDALQAGGAVQHLPNPLAAIRPRRTKASAGSWRGCRAGRSTGLPISTVMSF
ncbi:MAG: hypothetical protein HC783_02425 [Rhodobacteraceae bacterium]|nr:hypothetical protein [Paracoccaceae bacterium]